VTHAVIVALALLRKVSFPSLSDTGAISAAIEAAQH
jgi:hypothetical protein